MSSLRRPIAIRSAQHFESNDGPPLTTTVVERYGHRVELNTLEAAIFCELTAKGQYARSLMTNESDLNEFNGERQDNWPGSSFSAWQVGTICSTRSREPGCLY